MYIINSFIVSGINKKWLNSTDWHKYQRHKDGRLEPIHMQFDIVSTYMIDSSMFLKIFTCVVKTRTSLERHMTGMFWVGFQKKFIILDVYTPITCLMSTITILTDQ